MTTASALKPVEDLHVGELVRFTPGSNGRVDQVRKVHLRNSSALPSMVTVTIANGCWSKEVGELVEVVGRELDIERFEELSPTTATASTATPQTKSTTAWQWIDEHAVQAAPSPLQELKAGLEDAGINYRELVTTSIGAEAATFVTVNCSLPMSGSSSSLRPR